MTFSINTFSSNDAVDPNERKVTGVGSNIIDEKIKNLSQAKNINKLAKSKKTDFTKAKTKRAFGMEFFTPKAIVAFTQ